jgi:hypothetical protein
MTRLASGLIEGELPCAGCEYELHGLPRDGRCPECGEPVARALAGETLHHADPRWLGRLIVAGWLVLAGFLAVLVLDIGLVLLLSSIAAPGGPAFWITMAVASAASALLTAAGPLVLLGRPEPPRFDADRRLRRWAIRLVLSTVGLSLLHNCGFVISNLLLFREGGLASDAYIAITRAGIAVSVAATLTIAVAAGLTCLYASRILRRLPRSRLPAWFRVPAILIPLGLSLNAVITARLGLTGDFQMMSRPVWMILSGIVFLSATLGWLLAIGLFAGASWRLRSVRAVATRLSAPQSGTGG